MDPRMIHLYAHVPAADLQAALLLGIILGAPAGAAIAAWWSDRRR